MPMKLPDSKLAIEPGSCLEKSRLGHGQVLVSVLHALLVLRLQLSEATLFRSRSWLP